MAVLVHACRFAGGLAIAAAVARPASAEPGLRWRAPEHCPADATIHAELDHLLGPDWSARQIDLRIDVDVIERGEGFVATLDIVADGRSDRRTLTATDCRALAEATAYVMALMIDPGVALDPSVGLEQAEPLEEAPSVPPVPERPPTQPTQPKPTNAKPRADPSPRAASNPPPPKSDPVGGQLRLTASGLGGAIPGFGVGLRAGLGLRIRRAVIEVDGGYTWPRRAPLPSSWPDASVEVDLWTVGANAGLDFELGPVRVPVRLGFELGRLRGEGVGVRQSRTAQPLWSAARLGTGLVWPWGERPGPGRESRAVGAVPTGCVRRERRGRGSPRVRRRRALRSRSPVRFSVMDRPRSRHVSPQPLDVGIRRHVPPLLRGRLADDRLLGGARARGRRCRAGGVHDRASTVARVRSR